MFIIISIITFRLCFNLDFCIFLARFRTNGFICQCFVIQMVIWSWSGVTRPFIRAGRLSIGDYKCPLGAGTYNLRSIRILWLNKVWPLETIAITFTWDFILCFKKLTPPHVSTVLAYMQSTCREDIRVNTCGMQKFTTFYRNLPTMDCFLISAQAQDFSFVKLISRFQVWFQWFRPGYTSVGPLVCTTNLLKKELSWISKHAHFIAYVGKFSHFSHNIPLICYMQKNFLEVQILHFTKIYKNVKSLSPQKIVLYSM